MKPNEQDRNEEGYIVEFIAWGKSLKVTAFDPKSLREASIIGAAKASRKQLAALAVRKLHYVLKKERRE